MTTETPIRPTRARAAAATSRALRALAEGAPVEVDETTPEELVEALVAADVVAPEAPVDENLREAAADLSDLLGLPVKRATAAEIRELNAAREAKRAKRSAAGRVADPALGLPAETGRAPRRVLKTLDARGEVVGDTLAPVKAPRAPKAPKPAPEAKVETAPTFSEAIHTAFAAAWAIFDNLPADEVAKVGADVRKQISDSRAAVKRGLARSEALPRA